jgi:hypothetical protein
VNRSSAGSWPSNNTQEETYLSEENNNDKQPPKTEEKEIRPKGGKYVIHVYTARVPDEKLDDVVRIIINLLIVLGMPTPDA